MQVKAILSTDLPPYGLWQWVCGGLNVMDALLVVCWLGLTLTWTWAKSAGRIPRINGGMPQNLSLLLDDHRQSQLLRFVLSLPETWSKCARATAILNTAWQH